MTPFFFGQLYIRNDNDMGKTRKEQQFFGGRGLLKFILDIDIN